MLVALNDDDFKVSGYKERIAEIQKRLNTPDTSRRCFKPEFKDSRTTDADIKALSAKAFGCSVHFLDLHRSYERARVARLMAIRAMIGSGRSKQYIMESMRCKEKELTLACVEFDSILPCGAYTVQEMIQFGADGYGEIYEASPVEEIKYLVAERLGVSQANIDCHIREPETQLARDVFYAICRVLGMEHSIDIKKHGVPVRDRSSITRAAKKLEPIISNIDLKPESPAYLWIDAVARRLGK